MPRRGTWTSPAGSCRAPGIPFRRGRWCPPGAVAPAQGFVVLCHNLQAVSDYYSIGNLYGPYTGSLDNGGEDVILLDDSASPVEIDSVPYRDDPPWPAEGDGGGSSLELRNPRLNNELGESWAASVPSSGYGTPGMMNSTYAESIPPLISSRSRRWSLNQTGKPSS